jgi:hypothetical protein
MSWTLDVEIVTKPRLQKFLTTLSGNTIPRKVAGLQGFDSDNIASSYSD